MAGYSHKRKRGRPFKHPGSIGGHRSHTKLTVDQVKEIWYLLYEGKTSQSEIAKMFGVTQECVSHICSGTRWNSVTGLPRRSSKSTDKPPSGSVHGRPRKNYLKSLRRPKKADMTTLVNACVMAILRNEKRVTLRLSSLFKFPKDWPRSELKFTEDKTKIYSISAKSMLEWLHKNSYTNYTVKQVAEVNANFGLFTLLASDGVNMELLKEVIDENI